eukprot:915256-Alexandrium_andersonii.AAC.1
MALLPVAVVAMGHWVLGAWWRIFGLMAVVYVIHEVAEHSGLVSWLRTAMRVGSTSAWLAG